MTRPRVTVSYPDEKKPKQPASTPPLLNRYEDGMEKCIGCELCAACARPTASTCAASTPARPPGLARERYGYVYEINYLRCIHCDLCVEACPTEAITESKLFEFSFTTARTPSTPSASWWSMTRADPEDAWEDCARATTS